MSFEKQKYFSLCQTSSKSSLQGKGIVVASDITQEWLLPWWWNRYKEFNAYPVTFVDLGLSEEMKEWCKKRGNYVPIPISGHFVTEKEKISSENIDLWENTDRSKQFWDSRASWFRKPLACLQSPYEHSLWIDLDCEIKGNLEGAFNFCNHPSGISAIRETWEEKKLGLNSGVLAYNKNAPLMQEWASLAFEKHEQYKGDQDLLDLIEKEQNVLFGELPLIYNWSRLNEKNSEAIILHWHGFYGKSIIAHQIFKENNLFV